MRGVTIAVVIGALAGITLPAHAADSSSEAHVGPIKVPAEARTYRDLQRIQLPWAQRTFIAPFKVRAKGERWEVEATRFVENAFESWSLGCARSGEDWIAAEAQKILATGCKDPLVLYLAACFTDWSTGRWRAARALYESALEELDKTKGYPAALRWFVLIGYIGIQEDHDRSAKKVLPALVTATSDLLKDGSYGSKDDVLLVHHQLSWYDGSEIRNVAEGLSKLYRSATLPEWARHALLGKCEVDLAWLARGSDVADNVKPEGWTGFNEHLGLARRELVEAWKGRPDRPEAAWQMIPVVMGSEVAGDTERLWFDRAIAAQFDFQPAYSSMLIALRPRWGGSLDAVFAFGKACVETGRFDTCVPLNIFRATEFIITDLDDWRPFLRRPLVAKTLLTACHALLKEPTRQNERVYRLGSLAVNAWLTGEFAEAAAALSKAPAPLHPGIVRKIARYGLDENEFRGEVAVLASPGRNDFLQGEEAFRARRFDAAEKAFTAARDKGGIAGRNALVERLALLAFERTLESGKWTKVPIDSGLRLWKQWQGTWKVDVDGTLSIQGDEQDGFILFRGRPGENFECRGEFELLSQNPRDGGLQVMLGWHRDDDVEDFRWLGCSAYHTDEGGDRATLTDRIFASGANIVNTELKLKNQFVVRLENGKLSWNLNGQPLFEAHDLPGPNLISRDGLIGFGNAHLQRGTVIKIRALEIRRIVAAR